MRAAEAALSIPNRSQVIPLALRAKTFLNSRISTAFPQIFSIERTVWRRRLTEVSRMMAPIMSRVWPVDGTVNRPSHRFACRNMAAMAVWVFPSPSGPIRMGNVALHSVNAS